MDIRVKLDDIVQELDLQFDDMSSYLNSKTGDIVSISANELRAVENEEPAEKFPSWQQENIRIANEMLEEDYFISLPSKFDINEYEIMERFCLSIGNEWLSDLMYDSIKGRGAFRRFRENIQKFNIEQDWYSYRTEALKEMAIEWCEENGIKYE